MFTQITTSVTRSLATVGLALLATAPRRPSRRFVPCSGLENLEGRKAPSTGGVSAGTLMAPMLGAATVGLGTFTVTNQDEVVNDPPSGVPPTSNPVDPNGMLIFTVPTQSPSPTSSGPATNCLVMTA